jgi:hypothetical protein
MIKADEFSTVAARDLVLRSPGGDITTRGIV